VYNYKPSASSGYLGMFGASSVVEIYFKHIRHTFSEELCLFSIEKPLVAMIPFLNQKTKDITLWKVPSSVLLEIQSRDSWTVQPPKL
jgi:hypothetical protein